MAREDTIMMSLQELRRVHLVRQAMARTLTQGAAAALIGLTERQVRRLIQRVRQTGDRGVVHGGRGQPSNRRLPERLKAQVLRRYAQQYGDFGPTLAAEQLAARDGLRLSHDTLRRWLVAQGLTHFRRRKRPHRQWRERKAHRGALVQMDGSHHAWLEGRGPACVLMAYIDDASSRVFARFYEYEGTIPAMDSFTRYIRRYGLPLCVYLDKHSTYKSPAAPTVEEQLAGQEPMSQFERALAELGVEVIHAHSPQAKGRIERLFRTFQDRLIKALRLAGITTLEAANRFLEGYLPGSNRRFSVPPAQGADLHRSLPAGCDLAGILCLKTRRALRPDFTVAHHGRLYQIEDPLRATHVLVEERLDGSLRITHQGQRLRSHPIAARPVRPAARPRTLSRRPPWTPPPDHPWRVPFRLRRKQSVPVAAT